MPFLFSGDEGLDWGVDEATNVTDAYQECHNHFTDKINQVTIEVRAIRALGVYLQYKECNHEQAKIHQGENPAAAVID